MNESNEVARVIGRAERVGFPDFGIEAVPARIDTGARTSALWASDIQVEAGRLSFAFFGQGNPQYTGNRVVFETFETQVVASSNGIAEKRFKVKLLVAIKGKRVRASFTLANRSTQVYPVLIGRNVLLGKFVVDVKKGKPLYDAEQRRIAELQDGLSEEEHL